MTPSFLPVWGWLATLLVSTGMLAVIVWTYRTRLAALPPRSRRTLLGLRLAAWAILTFAMFRPAIDLQLNDDRPQVIVILGDDSRSMGIKEGTEGLTRRQQLLKVLAAAEPDFKAFPKGVELIFADFDKTVRVVGGAVAPAPVPPPGAAPGGVQAAGESPAKPVPVGPPGPFGLRPDALGEQTAMGAGLDSVLQMVRNKRVLTVLLLGDGAQRALPPDDLDPRLAARRFVDNEVRLDTVTIGTSALSGAAIDLAIEDFNVSPTVFVKNKVLTTAKLRALGAAQKDILVRLMIETPGVAGGPPQMKLAAPPKKIRPTSNDATQAVELEFVADLPGEVKLAVEAVPLDGETLVANNSITTFLTVLRGGINVAYFDTVRPEQKWIRRMDESPDIQLDFKEIRRIPSGQVTRLEPEWFEPGKYDVYILGDVPASVFGDELLKKLARSVEAGSGLIMLGGYHTFGAGGYATTPLADLLPVRMLRTEVRTGNEVDLTQQYDQPLQMLPHSQGMQHFVMRLDIPAKNAEKWRELAPLQGANRWTGLKPLAITLAESAEKYPLLVAQDVGRARTMAFAADTTYQWPQAGQLEQHQRFWQQVILWLAHKDVQGDSSLWVKLDTRRVRPGQPIDFSFGARDAQRQPITDAVFSVDVVGAKDKKWSVPPTGTGEDRQGKFESTQLPGEYRVVVNAKKDGQSVGMPAEARFIVYEQDLELHNPAADPGLLAELSRITGGTSVAPDKLGDHLKRLKREALAANMRQARTIELYDNWPLLILFVGVLSLEWGMRKRLGMV